MLWNNIFTETLNFLYGSAFDICIYLYFVTVVGLKKTLLKPYQLKWNVIFGLLSLDYLVFLMLSLIKLQLYKNILNRGAVNGFFSNREISVISWLTSDFISFCSVYYYCGSGKWKPIGVVGLFFEKRDNLSFMPDRREGSWV